MLDSVDIMDLGLNEKANSEETYLTRDCPKLSFSRISDVEKRQDAKPKGVTKDQASKVGKIISDQNCISLIII